MNHENMGFSSTSFRIQILLKANTQKKTTNPQRLYWNLKSIGLKILGMFKNFLESSVKVL